MTRAIVSLSLLVVLTLAPVAFAEETVREITWTKLEQDDRLQSGRVLAADAQTPFEQLVVENVRSRLKTIPILTLENPGITSSTYAIRGKVRYEDVQGTGYLEMWNHFPDEEAFFSRTLADAGLLQKLQGSSDWRTFVLPFYMTKRQEAGPEKLQINLVLPGSGTVRLSPLRLVQYGAGEDPLAIAAGQWWSDRVAGLVGGTAGSVLGLMGAVIGVLASRGRARSLVVVMMRAMLVIGVVGLVFGVTALVQSQPYGVYCPLLLIGILCLVLSAGLGPGIRRRYEQLELRKMSAVDAS